MAESRDLNIILKVVNNISSGLKPIESQLVATGKKMESLGKTMSLAITAPLVLAGALFTKASIDAEEVANKFNVVFKDVSDGANAVAKDLRDNYGMATSSAQDLLSATGDMLTGFGLTGQASLDLAERTNKLAVDLASFTNLQGGAKRASTALTKALLGERESVKELGIAILEEDVKAKVISMEATGMLTNETDRQKRAIATLEIAYEQSKNAIGDFARTQDSLANQLRTSKERLKEVSEQLGTTLIPLTTKMIGTAVKLIEKFSNLDETTRKLLIILGTFFATLGPAIFVVGKVITIISSLRLAILALNTAMIAGRVATLALLGPWAIAIGVAGVLAAVVGIKLFSAEKKATDETGNLKAEMDNLNASLEGIDGAAGSATQNITELSEAAKEAQEKIKALREEAVKINEDINKNQQDVSRDLAEELISQEQKVADIKKDIAERISQVKTAEDNKALQELQNNLIKEEKALGNAKFIRIELSEEVAEAERRASLSSFERRVEDILGERVLVLKRHLERLQEIVQEIKVEDDKNQAIVESFTKAQEAMRSESIKTTSIFEIESKKQIDALQSVSNFSFKSSTPSTSMLFPGRASGGPVSAGSPFMVGEKGPEVFVPSSNGNILPNGAGGMTVNVIVQGDVSGSELVEKVQEAIMGNLRLNTKLAI